MPTEATVDSHEGIVMVKVGEEVCNPSREFGIGIFIIICKGRLNQYSSLPPFTLERFRSSLQ